MLGHKQLAAFKCPKIGGSYLHVCYHASISGMVRTETQYQRSKFGKVVRFLRNELSHQIEAKQKYNVCSAHVAIAL